MTKKTSPLPKLATGLIALGIIGASLTGCTPTEITETLESLSDVVTATTEPTTPAAAPAEPAPTTSDAPTATSGRAALDSLAVSPAENGDAYARTDDFGSAWLDVDGNGCDTRNDILFRDLTDTTYKYAGDTCDIKTGTLNDPYTGQVIDFVQGERSMEVQIDHIIPLKYAFVHGAQRWTQEQRIALANDPINLRAADGPTNSSKGAKGPENWMPANTSFTCTYANEFITVAAVYGVSITSADKRALSAALDTCAA